MVSRIRVTFIIIIIIIIIIIVVVVVVVLMCNYAYIHTNLKFSRFRRCVNCM